MQPPRLSPAATPSVTSHPRARFRVLEHNGLHHACTTIDAVLPQSRCSRSRAPGRIRAPVWEFSTAATSPAPAWPRSSAPSRPGAGTSGAGERQGDSSTREGWLGRRAQGAVPRASCLPQQRVKALLISWGAFIFLGCVTASLPAASHHVYCRWIFVIRSGEFSENCLMLFAEKKTAGI